MDPTSEDEDNNQENNLSRLQSLGTCLGPINSFFGKICPFIIGLRNQIHPEEDSGSLAGQQENISTLEEYGSTKFEIRRFRILEDLPYKPAVVTLENSGLYFGPEYCHI